MIVKLKSYFAKLEDEERFKPEKERRAIPSITELAGEIDISRVQLQRMFGGDVKSLKLDVASEIIKSMRRRGFSMDVADFLEYRD